MHSMYSLYLCSKLGSKMVKFYNRQNRLEIDLVVVYSKYRHSITIVTVFPSNNVMINYIHSIYSIN